MKYYKVKTWTDNGTGQRYKSDPLEITKDQMYNSLLGEVPRDPSPIIEMLENNPEIEIVGCTTIYFCRKENN